MRSKALQAFALLKRQGTPIGRLALNLSAAEVCHPETAPEIARQVTLAGLDLRDIVIEFTEDVLLDRVSLSTLTQFTALRQNGAVIVIDDFGTGAAGLSHLMRLPLDGVKLDRQFVQAMENDPRARAIMRASVSLAHGLDLYVVAEGVETEQQDVLVRSLGISAAQGYFYCRPVPPSAITHWVLDYHNHISFRRNVGMLSK